MLGAPLLALLVWWGLCRPTDEIQRNAQDNARALEEATRAMESYYPHAFDSRTAQEAIDFNFWVWPRVCWAMCMVLFVVGVGMVVSTQVPLNLPVSVPVHSPK